MAIDDLDRFRDHLPHVFRDRPLPPEWIDEWMFIPLDDPEAVGESDLEGADLEELVLERDPLPDAVNRSGPFWTPTANWAPPVPIWPGVSGFPGAPMGGTGSGGSPPPDALAFYLPFHYFHPSWWGVYLTLEGVIDLAKCIYRHAAGALSAGECVIAARQFLYSHESFHHAVEAFSLRLETTHRDPLYAEGFEREFQRTYGTDDCLEEALANGHALRRVTGLNKHLLPAKRRALRAALEAFVVSSPPGYRMGVHYQRSAAYLKGRCRLAEDYHAEAIPKPPAHPDLWRTASYMFSGISRVGSRTNYLVPRFGPLAQRLKLAGRYIRYRDLQRKLQDVARCRVIRAGKGAHEIWERPDGQRFPVPRHPGDLATGTVRAIIREAGLDMSVSEFFAG